MSNQLQNSTTKNLNDVKQYWDSHLNCTQFLGKEFLEVGEFGSKEFFERIEATFNRYKYKLQYFEKLSVGCENSKLLEIGCGIGIELGLLSSLGFKVVGVDLAPAAVQLANEYLRVKGFQGNAVVGNAEQMGFGSKSFDVVYSSGVLHHTPNIEHAIAEIHRVLKDNGKILIVLYHRRSWFYLLHRLTGMHIEFEDEDAPIINSYTVAEVKKMFAVFRDLKITCEYYKPERTHRKGLFPKAFNSIFVPMMHSAPEMMIRPFGWHLVIEGTK